MKACVFGEVYLPLEGLANIDQYIAKIKKEFQKQETEKLKLSKKLDNPKFREKAPPEVIQEVEQKFHEALQKFQSLEKTLDKLN